MSYHERRYSQSIQMFSSFASYEFCLENQFRWLMLECASMFARQIRTLLKHQMVKMDTISFFLSPSLEGYWEGRHYQMIAKKNGIKKVRAQNRLFRVSIHSDRSSKFCNNFHNIQEFRLFWFENFVRFFRGFNENDERLKETVIEDPAMKRWSDEAMAFFYAFRQKKKEK